jgi:hypothetical protein
MTGNTENLVLEHLRAMRGDIGDIKSRLDRIDPRLSTIEQTVGSLYALSASDRETIDAYPRQGSEAFERLRQAAQDSDPMWYCKLQEARRSAA